jgi:S-adenosylmethionine hydrolase
MPRPEKTPTGWLAHVIGIDHFGNLTTDLPAEALQGRIDILLRLRGTEVHGLMESYGYGKSGELVALVDSRNFIEIAVVNGSAQKKLEAKVGDVVEVIFDVE